MRGRVGVEKKNKNKKKNTGRGARPYDEEWRGYLVGRKSLGSSLWVRIRR